jgi:hypothetical protein
MVMLQSALHPAMPDFIVCAGPVILLVEDGTFGVDIVNAFACANNVQSRIRHTHFTRCLTLNFVPFLLTPPALPFICTL